MRSGTGVRFSFSAKRSLFVFEKQDFKSYKPAAAEHNNWCSGDTPHQTTLAATLPGAETAIRLARARSSLLRLSYVTLPITTAAPAPVVPLFQLFSYSLIYLFLFFFFLNFIKVGKKNGTLEQIVVKSY